MSLAEKVTLGTPRFVDDGEDALYVEFPDRTVKYVPERTCRNAFINTAIGTHAEGLYSAWFECSECGFSVSLGLLALGEGYCPNCGAKVVG